MGSIHTLLSEPWLLAHELSSGVVVRTMGTNVYDIESMTTLAEIMVLAYNKLEDGRSRWV
jgi:hypothetical protein